MKRVIQFAALGLVLLGSLSEGIRAQESGEQVGQSPWGPGDEIGTLNRMTETTRLEILSRVSSGKVYDLGVEFFVGMPSFYGRGDPRYHYALTHTPRGNAVDDPTGIGPEMNEKIIYTGDVVSMYTHMGTHVDALNHFGLNGRIWNGFSADEHLGDRGWKKAGAETIPPVVARGVLIDVAAAKGLEVLPDAYKITARDLEEALESQGTSLDGDDVVLIRTGRMKYYYEAEKYMSNSPGLGLAAVKWLVEEKKAMMLGADNLSFEIRPSEIPDNWIPVHTYLLAEKGMVFLEVVNLEELARDQVYEFAFIGGSLKFRGASAAPMRPLAFPIK
ncbi:MAG: cyclase family protein [Acidobacteriota bacterium]